MSSRVTSCDPCCRTTLFAIVTYQAPQFAITNCSRRQGVHGL